MRYCSIRGTWPSQCRFGVVCSKCGCDVAFGDSYCKRCGRKLNKLQEYVSMDFVLKKITEAARCGNVPLRGEFVLDSPNATKEKRRDSDSTTTVGTRRDSDTKTVGTGYDSDSITLPTIETECPWGRDPKTCACMGLNGVCYQVVYPTYPPQHAYCPYSGKHGYVSEQFAVAGESLTHSIVQEDSAEVSRNAEGDKV